MTNLYFIRHGQIQANVDRIWHGSTDSPLTDEGVRQAQQMGEYVASKYTDISSIYSSPLQRTFATAQALADTMSISAKRHYGLREYGIGEFEGAGYEALMGDELGFFTSVAADENYHPQGGDSIAEVSQRMIQAVEEIVALHQGQSVAIVGHSAAIAIMLSTLVNGKAFPFYGYHMSNTGITHLAWRDTPEIVQFDEIEHLK